MDTTPTVESPDVGGRKSWITRTQETLAFRSRQGKNFHKLRNLFVTKRLIEAAIGHVLRNQGADTPGVDGVTKRHLSTEDARAKLCEEIYRELKEKRYSPRPVRRVYIPKPNGGERPLGIPTIKDRTVQQMLKLVLEPIYETGFYAHSYGFRPFRSTHHAALRIKDLIGRSYQWAVEGDIRKCFDQVDHEVLIGILKRRIKDGFVLRLIKDQLKAGILEEEQFYASEMGTPQGGIASPLLANIYLNELDVFIANKYESRSEVEKTRTNGRLPQLTRKFGHLNSSEADYLSLLWDGPKTSQALIQQRGKGASLGAFSSHMKRLKQEGLVVVKRQGIKPIYEITSKGKAEYLKAKRMNDEQRESVPCYIVRYADDFVILTKSEEDAKRLKEETRLFLLNRLKLTLSEEKTHITQASNGFNFLGFEIKLHPEYRAGACLVRPSEDKIKKFKETIRGFSREAWKGGRDAGDIVRLNLLLIGWGNYYRRVSSTRAFRTLDRFIWHRIFWDTYMAQRGRRFSSRRRHYLRCYLPYAKDIKGCNRWRKGRNYGRWADKAHNNAHIVTRLSFMPIEYVWLHPQLNPFFPEERATLEEDRRLMKLLSDVQRYRLPAVNPEYGYEWLVVRLKALRESRGRCAVCQRPLVAIRYGDARLIGHHKVPIKQFDRTEEANLLENVIALCSKCHSAVEQQANTDTQDQ